MPFILVCSNCDQFTLTDTHASLFYTSPFLNVRHDDLRAALRSGASVSKNLDGKTNDSAKMRYFLYYRWRCRELVGAPELISLCYPNMIYTGHYGDENFAHRPALNKCYSLVRC